MKFVYTIPLLLLLTGCCSTHVHPPAGDGYSNCKPDCDHQHRRWLFGGGYTAVNNTGFVLDVFQDGVLIQRGVKTGQVVSVRPALFANATITVIGRTDDGEYVGTDSWTFAGPTEVWTITRLYKPQPPR